MVDKMNRKFISVSLMLALSACAQAPGGPSATASIVPPSIGEGDNLRIGAPPPATPKAVDIRVVDDQRARGAGEVSKIREGALQEAAQSYGSQMGYARRAYEIMGRLEARSGQLSTAFDFNRVVSAAPVRAGVVIPPVVSRSFNAFTIDGGGTEASVADEYLTIVRPGRLAPVAPTWRDYLLIAAATPEEPARSLMPSEPAELALFQKWFDQSWAEGVKQADAEFGGRVDRLQRDFTGMLQYRRLVAQGMMDRMILANADFGVTGSGNEMRIGSRTVQVTSEAAFRTDPTRWSIRDASARDALIVDTGEIPSLSSIMK